MTALPLSFVPDSFGERWPHGVEPAVKICVDPDHMSTSDDMWVIQQLIAPRFLVKKKRDATHVLLDPALAITKLKLDDLIARDLKVVSFDWAIDGARGRIGDKTEADYKIRSDSVVKLEVKFEPDVKIEPAVKVEAGAKEEPGIKSEPGLGGEDAAISAGVRDVKPILKREVKTEQIVASTGQLSGQRTDIPQTVKSSSILSIHASTEARAGSPSRSSIGSRSEPSSRSDENGQGPVASVVVNAADEAEDDEDDEEPMALLEAGKQSIHASQSKRKLSVAEENAQEASDGQSAAKRQKPAPPKKRRPTKAKLKAERAAKARRAKKKKAEDKAALVQRNHEAEKNPIVLCADD